MKDRNQSKNAELSRSSSRRILRTRGLLGGGTLLSGLVAALVLTAPLASAHGTVTFTAPFTGFSMTQSNFTATSGCAHLHQSASPTWSSANGTFQFGASTSTSRCASGYAQAYSSIALVSPVFSSPHVGFGYLYITLGSSFSAKASVVLAPGNISNGTFTYAYADVSLVVGAYIYDATHHNYSLIAYSTTTIVQQLLSTTGSFSLTMGPSSQYVYAYGTFTGGHVYELYFDITASIYAYSYGTGSSAAASLNLAGTNGLTVGSIVVS